MTNFDLAFSKTMKFEGRYSNDPVDAGGETYKGITRKYEPDWEGWKIIDDLKNKPNFPAYLEYDENLQDLVKQVYKEKYWNINQLDLVFDQTLAEEMFDTGVNMGTKKAATFLQISLNCLNKNQTLYSDIDEDGKIGNQTLTALKVLLNKETNETLLKLMNVLQGMHYIDYMRQNPAQEKFARGWFTRVSFSKD